MTIKIEVTLPNVNFTGDVTMFEPSCWRNFVKHCDELNGQCSSYIDIDDELSKWAGKIEYMDGDKIPCSLKFFNDEDAISFLLRWA